MRRMDVKAVLDWITTLEDFCEWYDVKEEKHVIFVKIFLVLTIASLRL